MADYFLKTMLTPTALDAQEYYYGRRATVPPNIPRDTLGPDEADFIAQRDSFYMATVTSDGWPYVQHRGGPAGFLKVLSPRQLAFADFTGNRQLISTGNLAANRRVALFLMDYPRRERLKILGHARVMDARRNPQLAKEIAGEDPASDVERLLVIEVVALDWNCRKHITPRYTEREVEQRIAALKQRISELEAQWAATRETHFRPREF